MFAKLEVLGVRSQNSGARRLTSTAQPTKSKIQMATRWFLTGRPFKVVVMTFITHEFSGGPWTKAVQGPK
jgi:hypothetical protein